MSMTIFSFLMNLSFSDCESALKRLTFLHLLCLQMFFCLPVVKLDHSITTQSSGLYSVSSDLNMKVEKKDKDAVFYCEVTFLVPGAEKMLETKRINITVFCE